MRIFALSTIIIITTQSGYRLQDSSCGYHCINRFCHNTPRLEWELAFLDRSHKWLSEHHLKHFYYVHSKSRKYPISRCQCKPLPRFTLQQLITSLMISFQCVSDKHLPKVHSISVKLKQLCLFPPLPHTPVSAFHYQLIMSNFKLKSGTAPHELLHLGLGSGLRSIFSGVSG